MWSSEFVNSTVTQGYSLLHENWIVETDLSLAYQSLYVDVEVYVWMIFQQYCNKEFNTKYVKCVLQREEGLIQGQLNHSDSRQYINALRDQIAELKNEVGHTNLTKWQMIQNVVSLQRFLV